VESEFHCRPPQSVMLEFRQGVSRGAASGVPYFVGAAIEHVDEVATVSRTARTGLAPPWKPGDHAGRSACTVLLSILNRYDAVARRVLPVNRAVNTDSQLVNSERKS